MARHIGKGKGSRKFSENSRKSFRKSQAWRYLSRKDNADNFEGRTVLIGGKGLGVKEQPDTISNITDGDKDQEQEDLQVHFVGNTIKSSKYTILTFIPR